MNDKTNSNEQQPVFRTQRIDVKESIFDAPLTPLVFKKSHSPKIEMQVQINYNVLKPDIYDTLFSKTKH